MKRFKMVKSISLALGFVALCASPPMLAGDQVPFRGNFDLVILESTPLDATHVHFDVGVQVRATHLGNAQGPGFVVLDVTSFTYTGSATWIASNGDSVVITFAGRFVPATTRGILENIETFEVVGGTGRFNAATGAGIVRGQLDAATLLPLKPAQFEGSISSSGSLKK